MKKKFTKLTAALALLALFILPTTGWGQTKDTKTDVMFAKGFASYTGGFDSNDHSAVANSANETGVTYAMRVINGGTGQVRGNQNSAASNFSCRNTTTYDGYYISSVSLTVSGGTLDGSTNGRSVVYFGTSAYSAPSSTTPSGTCISASPSSSGQATLTWTNSNENVSYFILYNLKTANSALSANAQTPLTVVWAQKTSGTTDYSVTYDANGATTGSVPTDATTYNSTNNTVTVLGNDGSLAKTGHEWSGWCLNSNGTGTVYGPNDGQTHTYTISENTTFYAKWNPNVHTITMPNDDGYGSYTATSNASSGNYEYGSTITLTYTPATGYENYEASWTVNGTAINGNEFQMPDENVTVGVTINESTSWTYTHSANDGNGSTTGTWVYTNYDNNHPSNFTVQQTKVGQTDIATTYSELRLYSGHYLEIFPATNFNKVMTSVIITCSTDSYATALQNSAFSAGENSSQASTVSSQNISVSNSVVTIDLSNYSNIAYLKVTASAKTFISSITVNYANPVVATYYNINYATSLTNGAFATTGNPTSAIEGQNITITTVPDQNYRLATLTYTYGGIISNATINGNEGSFEMPGSDIDVNATFELIPAVTATFTDGVYTETMLTQASFDNWNTYSVEGDQTWGFASGYGAKISGYANSTCHANQDWLISPTMAVANGKLDITFECAAKNGEEGTVTIWYSKDYPGRGNPTNYSWTQLTPTPALPYANSTWDFQSASVTITDANMDNIHFAFKYVSTSTKAGTFEMKNFTAKQYYTITVGNPDHGSIMADPDDIAVVGSEVEAIAVADQDYHFVSWNITPSSVTIENDKFTMPAENVTLSATFEADITYTITYNENGATNTDDVLSGPIGSNLLDSPVSDDPANLTFVGWSTSQISKYATAQPELVDATYNVTGNVTFYAVYKYDYSYNEGGGTATWTKVTDASTLAAGDQLVIASDVQNVVATETITTSSNANYMSETGEDDLFENDIMNSLPTGAAVLTLGGEENAWTLANSSNQLLGATAVKKLAWGSGTTTWSISISSGDATIQNGTSSYGKFLHNVSSKRFTTYSSEPTNSMLLPQLYRLEGGSTTVSGTYYLTSVTEIASSTQITGAQTLSNNVTINGSTGSYNISGSLNSNGYLIINDQPDRILISNDAQLFHTNAVAATVQKDIEAYTIIIGSDTEKTNGWYFIASPLTTDYTPAVPMIANDYDLYRLNGTTWENAENSAHSGFTLANGHGYLYANNTATTLSFAGETKGYDNNANTVAVTTGFNLIGNPYTFNTYINGSFYVMNDTHDGVNATAKDGTYPIKPCTGVIVEAAADGQVAFSNEAISNNAHNGNVNMTLSQQVATRGNASSVTLDNAIVSFNEGSQLSKFYFGQSNANIYIPQNGKDYAIVSAEAQGEMPVCFKASVNGSYTLSFDAENVEMGYLHLIDNLTGMDVDLLATPSYNFEAKTSDYASRFRLVFSANNIAEATARTSPSSATASSSSPASPVTRPSS